MLPHGSTSTLLPGSWKNDRLATGHHHDVSEEPVDITEEISGHDMTDPEQCELRWRLMYGWSAIDALALSG